MKTIDSETAAIITPAVVINNMATNAKLQMNGNKIATTTVHFSDDNLYVLQSKDGSIPDIAFDDNIVELIIKAKTVRNAMADIHHFFENDPNYDKDILNNKKVMDAILHAYLDAPASDINTIARGCIEAQRYRK